MSLAMSLARSPVVSRRPGPVALLLAACLALAGCVSARPVDLSGPPPVAQTTLVFDARGRLVTALHGAEDRTPVPLAKVSRWLRTAIVDTEDARFYEHEGVDWPAVVRAAAHDLRRGRVVEGGSTITQQYVKNVYTTHARTLRRKLQEATLAWELERQHAKGEILEAYLNTVYFGEGAYGVEVAARTYFSTSAARLTLPQAALLAGPGDPYGALAAVEPGTGAVRAMVGGRDFFADSRYGRVNLATGTGGTGRQAGSAFKTFALVAAVERGIPPEAVFRAPDRVTLRRPGHGRPYSVRNYEGEGFGSATLREATALSINTVYALLLLRLGGGDPDRGARAVVETAARMGVARSRLAPDPSVVLGTGSVTPLELAGAYATLAAEGRHAEPFGVSRITDARGRVLYQARPDPARVLGAPVAAIVDDVLRGVVEHGTGVGAAIGRPAAGKTGTTQGNADAWFAGYTPALAAAVWVGFPQGRVPMTPPRTASPVLGGTLPAAIWARFMRRALAGRPAAAFPAPATRLVTVMVDVGRNCRPNRFTRAADVGPVTYLAGTEPAAPCTRPAGPLPGVVPVLVGLPAATAAAWLGAAGLRLVRHPEETGAAAPGTVLRQSPPGGTARAPGSPVDLTVAAAPGPATGPAPATTPR